MIKLTNIVIICCINSSLFGFNAKQTFWEIIRIEIVDYRFNSVNKKIFYSTREIKEFLHQINKYIVRFIKLINN